MIRKALLLLAPVAAIAAVALAPVSATAHERCSDGRTDPKYCERVCVVPELRGLTVRQAEEALDARDCELGDVERCRSSEPNGDGGDRGRRPSH